MDIPVELEPKGLSSQASVSPTCRMEVWPRGCWDLGREAGEGGAPLAYPQGTWDPGMSGQYTPCALLSRLTLAMAGASGGSGLGTGDVGGLWPVVSGSGGWLGFGGPRCCHHSRHAGKLVRWLAVGLQQTDFMSVCFCNTFL